MTKFICSDKLIWNKIILQYLSDINTATSEAMLHMLVDAMVFMDYDRDDRNLVASSELEENWVKVVAGFRKILQGYYHIAKNAQTHDSIGFPR